MLSWLFEIWFWNLNHKQFKVLENFWPWNHTKIMHQIIVINFSKFLSNYSLCWRQDVHFFLFDLSFFFYFVFWSDSFFSWFFNTSICIDPDFHNFSSTYFNFITKNSQHRIEKQSNPNSGIKNRLKKLQKHNGIDVYEFVWI